MFFAAMLVNIPIVCRTDVFSIVNVKMAKGGVFMFLFCFKKKNISQQEQK